MIDNHLLGEDSGKCITGRAPESMECWEQRSRTNDFSLDKVSDNLTEDFFKDYDILIKWSDDCNILDKLSNDCNIYWTN